MVESAALQISLPGALQIGQELESQGYYSASLVAQWHLVHEALWLRIRDLTEPRRALHFWSEHPEPKVRFFAPRLWALWGVDEPEMALEGLLPLADDLDFRVLESVQAFGVRPFAHSLGPTVLDRLQDWFTHSSPRIRRSAICAVRPRGFWVRHLQWAVEDPGYLAPVLEGFRGELERFPANAVANCFNDISRRHPLFCLTILHRWQERLDCGPQAEHIARKGLRSLLKEGDARALALFGFGPVNVSMSARLKQGEVVTPNSNLHFELELQNQAQDCAVELVYEIETTGRNLKRPRRKKYQGGSYQLSNEPMALKVRERIFDRKAALLLDGPAVAKFYLNGVLHAKVDFRIERDAEFS